MYSVATSFILNDHQQMIVIHIVRLPVVSTFSFSLTSTTFLIGTFLIGRQILSDFWSDYLMLTHLDLLRCHENRCKAIWEFCLTSCKKETSSYNIQID